MNKFENFTKVSDHLVFSRQDLEGLNSPSSQNILHRFPLSVGEGEKNGECFSFHTQGVNIWEGEFKANSEVIISYTAEKLSTHFFLLIFDMDKPINLRANVSVDTKLLDSRALNGSVLWLSNVGLEISIQAGTKGFFQCIVLNKQVFLSNLNQRISSHFLPEKLSRLVESSYPLFCFPTATNNYINTIYIKNKIPTNTNIVNFATAIMSKYLYIGITFKTEKTQITLWDLYCMFSIRQLLEDIPVTIKPNVAQLANLFNYKTTKLSSLFKAVFGISIEDYHVDFNMEYARTLIESTDMLIDEVSNMIGFKDMRTFQKNYKKHFGENPGKFKNSF
jgi:AraC-like DNA-binding protein